jgi:outer membrane protein OmpU
MNKLLLTTAAIALSASPVLASDIKVSVGGYFTSMYYNVDSDNTGVDYVDSSLQEDAEIIFKGKGVAGNGIEYGFQVELEAASDTGSTGDQIDEHYIYVKGGFGKVIVGAENSAAYLMQVMAPNFLAYKTWDNNFNTWDKVATFEKPLHDNYSGDANKVSYMSPKLNGLQIGLSYTPSNTFSGGAGVSNANTLLVESTSKYEDVYSYAVSYGTKLGGVDVKASYTYEEGEMDTVTHDESSIGLQLKLGNFAIGGNYFESDEETIGNTSVNDWEIYHYGISYKMGATTLGIAFQDQEDAASTGTNNDTDVTIIGGNTKLMDGVALTYSYEMVESGNTSKGDSEFLGLGLALKF